MTYDQQGRRVLQGHPSTWPQEVEQLRAQKQELALQVLAAEGQAEEAYKAQQQAEARVQELERDNGRLRTALEWYRDQHRISGKPTIDAGWAMQRLKTDGGARANAALQKRDGFDL